MVKMTIGLLVLLAICVVVGVLRKYRGGTFLPPDDGDKQRPRNLADLHDQRKK